MVGWSLDADPGSWGSILGTQSRGLQGIRTYPASRSPKAEQSMHFEIKKAAMVWWHKRRGSTWLFVRCAQDQPQVFWIYLRLRLELSKLLHWLD
jgi:hypothetical protein